MEIVLKELNTSKLTAEYILNEVKKMLSEGSLSRKINLSLDKTRPEFIVSGIIKSKYNGSHLSLHYVKENRAVYNDGIFYINERSDSELLDRVHEFLNECYSRLRKAQKAG